ncbi:stage II sporulation protein M [Methanopyrus sp.]
MGVKPFRTYLKMSLEVFTVSGVIGIGAYLAFPKLPDLILETVKYKVEMLAGSLPLPAERITISILLWNTLAVMFCAFGGLFALLMDKLVIKLLPDPIRESFEDPPYSNLLIRVARALGYNVSEYKEADVILTLKLGPLIVPFINGVAAGSFLMWLINQFGPLAALGAIVLPHGLIEFPTLLVAAALGMYLSDYLIHRVEVHRKWPDVSLEPPRSVIRAMTACIILLAEAAFLEVHVTPVVAGCVMKCA